MPSVGHPDLNSTVDLMDLHIDLAWIFDIVSIGSSIASYTSASWDRGASCFSGSSGFFDSFGFFDFFGFLSARGVIDSQSITSTVLSSFGDMMLLQSIRAW